MSTPTEADRELRQLVFDTVIMAEVTEDANGRSDLVDARTQAIASHVAAAVEKATKGMREENATLREQNDSLCKRVVSLQSGVCWVKANAELEALRAEVAELRERAIGFEFALDQERNIHMTTIAERDQLRADAERLAECLRNVRPATLNCGTIDRQFWTGPSETTEIIDAALAAHEKDL